MAELKVTVTVNSDDLLDVLAWHEGSDLGWDDWKPQPSNDRWLAAYQDADGARREELFSLMPASLQWAVHEVERRGVVLLRAALDEMGISCRPRTDHDECREELHSWAYFNQNQVDSYWMRCHLLGPHEEHENSETGARWKTPVESLPPEPIEVQVELAHFTDASHVGLERGLPELLHGDTQLGGDITGFPGESGIHLEPDHMLGHAPQPTHGDPA